MAQNSNYYSLSIRHLLALTLPTMLRGALMLCTTAAIAKVIDTAYTGWMAQRSQHWYRLNHNGQVCYLQAALNDTLDSELRRITITDSAEVSQWVYIYHESNEVFRQEIGSDASGAVELYKDADLIYHTSFFDVHLPSDLSDQRRLLARFITNRYKILSKRANYLFDK